MDESDAFKLIDSHLDQQPLTQEQADALAVWLKQQPEHADRAFYHVFLHSFLRQRIKLGALLPSTSLSLVKTNVVELPALLIDSALHADISEDHQPEKTAQTIFRWFSLGLLVLGLAVGVWWTIEASWSSSAPLGTTIAYEGFDYAPTDPPAPLGDGRKWPTTGGMQGLAGGLGWAEPWRESGQKVSVLIADTQANAWRPTDMRRFGLLGYSDSQGHVLKSAGIQLRTAAGPVSESVRKFDVSAFPAALVDSKGIGRDGGVLWLSFLVQSFDGRGLGNFACIQLGTNAACLRIGKLESVPSGNWSAAGVLDGAELNSQWSDIPSGNAVFLVTRVTFRPGGEQVDIWANPGLDFEPLVASATIRLQVPDFQFDSVSIISRYTTDFDEIRLGSSFRSVVPLR